MTKKYPDLMLDLETAGISYDAAIVQIAIIPFDLKASKISPKTQWFCKEVNLINAVAQGCTISESTIEWWEKQDPDLYNQVFSGTESLEYVLNQLNDFIKTYSADNIAIWSHATFDPVILASAYRLCDLKPNFPFWVHKDLRTIEYLSDISTWDMPLRDEMLTAHNALKDCEYQISCLAIWHNAVKNTNNAT